MDSLLPSAMPARPAGGPILDRLKRLHPKIIDLSLDRIEDLLKRLGNPERNLPPVVHVAGTNGKGSVVAYVRAGLEAAGHRVHVYTSPHLARFNERIRLAGRLIEDEPLTALLEECERVNGGQPITFFEITTAAAFLAFARVPADIVLLEVGLGGRLDATNVIARPAVTVITPVSLDHQHYLGDTLAAIAGEKAGILKPDVPCVMSRQAPEAECAIVKQANTVGASLSMEGRDWSAREMHNGMAFERAGRCLMLPSPGLLGEHQIGNAGAAIAALQILNDAGFRIPEEAWAKGLTNVEWPARLQRLTRGPLLARLPKDWQLWLDGGHNPAAGEALAAQARAWRLENPRRPLHLVSGMLNTKDPAGFFRPFASFVEDIHTVAIPGEANSLSAADLAAVVSSLGLKTRSAASVDEALNRIAADAGVTGRVLICGSLYLAGTVLVENG